MQRYTVYFYTETALLIWDFKSTGSSIFGARDLKIQAGDSFVILVNFCTKVHDITSQKHFSPNSLVDHIHYERLGSVG
jgi:hypothetical protein